MLIGKPSASPFRSDPFSDWATAGESFIDGDLVGPAMQVVNWLVNSHLRDLVAVQLASTEELSGLELALRPLNLAGVLWLQASQAMERGLEFRKCGECGRWFEVTPKMGEKKLCSDACKMRAFRRNKKKGATP
jgi:hypothetical protein